MNDSWMNIPYSDITQITTISLKINFLGGKVGGPRYHKTFTITNTNIK